MIFIIGLIFSLASCAGIQPPAGKQTVAYEERSYGRNYGPLKIEAVPRVLQEKSWGSGALDLTTRELKLTVAEPLPWGFPKGPIHIGHAADLWRLRQKRIGYLNLFLIRHDAGGTPARIVRLQLGENGDMHPNKPDLLRHARTGDLILGMRGF